MNFDFNKLDSYKAAIDDGVFLCANDLAFCYFEDKYNLDLYNGNKHILDDENWETFKKKVADYFLENN